MSEHDALYQRVYDAAERVQDTWELHPLPSPSTLFDCQRKLWFQAQRVLRAHRIPPRSIKKMAAGKRIEPFWRDVYYRASFVVMELSEDVRIKVGGSMTGEFDALLVDVASTPPEYLLLELKDLGVWSYLTMHDQGLQAAERGYYQQMQQYMGALRQLGVPVTRGIFHAGQADASAVVWIWQKIKRREGRPPDFLVEYVPFDPAAYETGQQRAKHLTAALNDADTLPKAEYDPTTGKYPCGSDETPYCGWRAVCLRQGLGACHLVNAEKPAVSEES